ncbi:hypothetical protein ACVW0Y_002981 [Pseudomonas sp. TE3786]
MSTNRSIIFTEEPLAEALGKVQSVLEMSVELIAQCVLGDIKPVLARGKWMVRRVF